MNLFSKHKFLNKLKAKARDRKGLGMELAVMVLLVVLGCSTLLLTSAIWNRNILTEKEEQIIERLAIDEFVESNIVDILKNESAVTQGEYSCTYNGSIYTVTKSSTNVLEFEIEKDDNKIKITSWTYN